jgi:hypothetical protein
MLLFGNSSYINRIDSISIRVIHFMTIQGSAFAEAISETFGLITLRDVRTKRLLGFLIRAFEVRADQYTNCRLLVF